MNGWTGRSLREIAHEARRALGIDDLILAVHDASFPGDPGEDTGRGTPYSKAAHRLCAFADGLGFTGLQLGPQGVTTHVNRSPYDSTVFSRNPLSISLASLHEDPAWEGLLDRAALEAATGHGSLGERGRPRVDDAGASAGAGRVQHDHAEEAHARALDEAFRRFEQASSPALRARFDAFRRERKPSGIAEMLFMDLTKTAPRSAKDKLAGIVSLKRTIDKSKANDEGHLGDYHYDCPHDKRLGIADCNAVGFARRSVTTIGQYVAARRHRIPKPMGAGLASGH